jgi:hypothetical protein
MSEKQSIKLKKISEDEVHGPMDMAELVELSCSAFVAPEDEVSFDDGEWSPAHLVPELEMVWIVRTGDGIEYGPTSPGTMREFLMVGEISEETTVFHKDTEEDSTVGDVLGATTVSQVKEEQRQVEESGEKDEAEDADVSHSMDVARDLHIRQLETDLNEMESKYNSLMLKYRKATEELTTLKQG